MTQATAAEGSPRVDGATDPHTGWAMPESRPSVPREAKTARARLVSALCFGAVSVAMAVVGLFVALLGGLLGGIGAFVGFLGVGGIPAALILGWTFGPRAGWAPRDQLAGFGFGVGALAVLIGDLTVVASAVAGSTIGAEPGASGLAGSAIVVYVVGLVVLGLPALIVTVLASWAWMALLRRVAASQVARRDPVATTT
ncbi:MAG TPA: hypothetical protein VF323_13445 [Candidatus Limnocylindrales bacterium]